MDRMLYSFDEPLPKDADSKALLGGKGASLKEMTLAGLKVPPGFTITTECCADYLAAGNRWPDGLEQQLDEHLSRLEQTSGRIFGRGAQPLLVSVRSGAARSMPGMMDTLLNCGLHPGLAEDLGDDERFWSLWIQFVLQFVHTITDADMAQFDSVLEDRPASREVSDDLLAACKPVLGREVPTHPRDILTQCIDAVFDSWNNDRAVDYRRRNGIRGLNGTAVNIQMMWPSEVSGIVFTQDPAGLDRNRMIIESSYGLGEAVVSGDVTPDVYTVPRDQPESFTVEVGDKTQVFAALGSDRPRRDPSEPSLNAEELAELVDLSLRVEDYFAHPVDVEWGLVDGQFALLQSRAIRGLDIAADVDVGRTEEIQRLRVQADGSRKVWVAHNLGETLPTPTPLTWDIVREFMSGEGGFGRLYQLLGYRPSKEVRREGFLELICGRIYADPDRLPDLFWAGMPMEYDLDELLEDRSLLDQAPSRFAPDRADSRFLINLPGNLWGMFRSHCITRRMGPQAKDRFENRVLPDYLEWVREKRRQDLASLDWSGLVEELNHRRVRVLQEFAPESLLPGFFGGMALSELTALLTQILGPEKGPTLAGTLTLALEGDMTFEQDAMLFDVARGEGTLEDFLDKFGHRCLGEMELSNPRYREDPSYLEKLIHNLKQSDAPHPRDVHESNHRKREKAEKQLPDLLAEWGGSSFEPQVRDLLQRARLLLPYRETGKYYLMMGYELIRCVTEEMASRSSLGGDLYFLQLDELADLMNDEQAVREVAAGRRIRHASAQRLYLPDVIDSEQLDDLGNVPDLESSDEMSATCLAGGVGSGPARIVSDPASADDLGSGYVLVCSSTDPGWTPLFMQAAGLIVERGGALSHGAIVARDFGIPAVALPNATRLIPDGSEVRVDGNNGKVYILESSPVSTG
ncbi:MAG: PEP/pyruvate-binding domain-containing protein [Phycisphaerae bacterium]